MIYSSELRAPGEHKELAVGVDLYVHLVGLAHHQGAVAGGAVPLEALLAVTTQAISTHTLPCLLVTRGPGSTPGVMAAINYR